jgi:hypothetical protein
MSPDNEGGYVLDGIRTALRSSPAQESVGDGLVAIECRCGWRTFGPDPLHPFYLRYAGNWTLDSNAHLAALRFHYTHCPSARLPADHERAVMRMNETPLPRAPRP